MKFPFEFGTKLVFRLIFPGLILAVGMLPFVHAILDILGVRAQLRYTFPVEAIAWGWMVSLSDIRIYMLLEGRRYWPGWLRRASIALQRRRLQRLQALVDNRGPDRRRYLEAGVDYALYPMDEGGVAYVEHPTRLGNIIESFEVYPLLKYGLDSIFFWYRLWVVLDKDLREELDNAQAVVDSSVYTVFVLGVCAVITFVLALFEWLTGSAWYGLHGLSRFHFPYAPGADVLFLLAPGCVLLAYMIYRLSLAAHAQFGELFKATFDQYRKQLSFKDVAADVAAMVDGSVVVQRSQREKNRMVFRYLRWHMIRDEARKENVGVGVWESRPQTKPVKWVSPESR